MDYRKILLAYIKHVLAEEGCDFIPGVFHDMPELNDAERQELQNLAEEARKK